MSSQKVIIVGAGLGGAMMACLLEKSGIPYEILERGDTVTFLGTAVALSAGSMTVIDQLGLMKEFEAISKPVTEVVVHSCKDGKVGPYGALDYTLYRKRCGYDWRVCTRFELHALLISQLPPNKIQLKKKVVNIVETNDNVTVFTEDGSSITGSIVIGADGNNSIVRKFLQESLKLQGKLSKHDANSKVPFDFVAVIGITQPLDLKEFPSAGTDSCDFNTVIRNGSDYAWSTFSTQGRLSFFMWANTRHLSEQERLRLSQGPRQEIIKEIMDKTQDFPTSYGGKMKDLFTHSLPQDLNRVVIEEKIYDSWYSGRLVLMGDAAHKVHPGAGLNANHAMMDAVVLANVLHELDSFSSTTKITKAFKQYHRLRYPLAKEMFMESNLFGRLMACKTFMEKVPTVLLLKYLPKPIYIMVCDRLVQSRPQATFLPQIPCKGSIKPKNLQPPSKKERREKGKDVDGKAALVLVE